MLYTVNHEMQTLHTVKPGSDLEVYLTAKNIVRRTVVTINNVRHSVFGEATDAKAFHATLVLDGGQI